MAKILVVDDDSQIIELLKIALERTGHEVDTARSGQEAIDSARSGRPALILLDLVMPDMTGREVLEQIRSDPDLAQTPVVLATGEVGADSDLDVMAVLTKPYKLDALYQVVEQAALSGGREAGQ